MSKPSQAVDPKATIRKFRMVQTKGNHSVSQRVDQRAIEATIAVGDRVRLHQGGDEP